ncbi:family 11 glycoside hydrolase [Piromyces sp. E2]|nr:family 11 glycoside hydrolase [Piromyces sp. E2]|eukprot:OUM67390.1 family 11 glycoside hydrolase [Piromyces sp. E2]
MKFSRVTLLSLASALAVNAQSFCNGAKHSGQSIVVNSNRVGSIGGVGYELWADSGSNSATFYSDGSFSCSFRSAKDYLCRAGLSFNSDKTHQQIGHMYADFKLVKQGIQNVDYSYVGIYGWTRNPLVEFYVVDNWLSQYRPGDWVGNKKHGDFTIDGAQYTVYENTRYGPSIEGNTQFKQYFSIRKQARDCGTIDITAHFQQWEKLGMKMGKMHEAKVLGEAGSNGGGTSGTADFPYAKVYIGNGNQKTTTTTRRTTTTTRRTTTTSRRTSTTKSLPSSNNNCSAKIIKQGYNFCNGAKHSGQSIVVNSNRVGSIGGVGYELWADSGSNSATFYSDGSFSCSFRSAKDYLCRAGLSFNSDKTHQQIGHMYADFKLVKQGIQNVDYSYVGIYGWTRNPLVEFYVVDNWLSQYRPGDWVGNKKHGDFTIDGAQYTVYENTRYGPSIDGDTQFKQYFSIRKQARDCGTIDITAHFQQWEKLGMKMGKMHEAKVLGEAGSNGGGTSGTADFPYAKVYIGNGNGNGNGQQQQPKTTTTKKTTTKSSQPTSSGKCSSNITRQGYKCCSANCIVFYSDNDGNWGYENDQWCGCANAVKKCKNVFGYSCCKSSRTVYFTDEDGKWSVENNEWCLIN